MLSCSGSWTWQSNLLSCWTGFHFTWRTENHKKHLHLGCPSSRRIQLCSIRAGINYWELKPTNSHWYYEVFWGRPGVACWRDASRRWELLRLVPTGSRLLPHFTQECGGHLSHYHRHAGCGVILLNGPRILRLAGWNYWGFYQNQAISQLTPVGPGTPLGAWDWDKM